jgi:hypothetical protein
MRRPRAGADLGVTNAPHEPMSSATKPQLTDHQRRKAAVSPFPALPLRLHGDDPLRWWNQLGTDAGRVFLVRPPTLAYERLAPLRVKHVARATGLAPRLVDRFHHAAFACNWHILVRPIKPAAWHHVGRGDALPKPPEIKSKTDARTGLVRMDRERLASAITWGEIDESYAKLVGLTVDSHGFLVNRRGQRYYSDVDLYDVIDGATGRQVNLGRGTNPLEGHEARTALDALVNELHGSGAPFRVIQHGAHRQWVKGGDSPLHGLDARVVAFRPHGVVTYLDDEHALASFLAALASAPMSPWW